jgi:hypothetical protein
MAQKIVAITIDEAELKQLQQAGLNPPAVLRRGLDLSSADARAASLSVTLHCPLARPDQRSLSHERPERGLPW